MDQNVRLEKELQEIRGSFYRDTLGKLLERATDVLKVVTFELSTGEYPVLLSGQYSSENGASVAVEMSGLLRADKSGQLLRELNACLAAEGSTVQFGTDFASPSFAYRLKNVEGTVLVSAVYNWLNKMSADEQEKNAWVVLNTWDEAKTMKCLLYTQLPGSDDKVFLSRVEKKYGETAPVFGRLLQKCLGYRNQFIGHSSASSLGMMAIGEVKQVVDSVKALVQPFRKATTQTLQNALDRFDGFVQSKGKRLTLAPMVLEEQERKLGLTAGTLATTLAKFRHLRDVMDQGKTVLLFTPEDELLQYLGTARYTPALAKEMQVQPTDIASERKNSLRFPALCQYKSGMLTPAQTEELVSQVTIIADLSTLLSVEAMQVVTRVMGPMLKRKEKQLLIEWATLVHLYRTEKDDPDETVRARAHDARLRLYHLQKMGLVRYVGDTDHVPDPDVSLMQFVQRHKETAVCVMTANRMLAAQLTAEESPLCLTLTNWRKDGLMVRTVSRPRLASLWEHEEILPTNSEKVVTEASAPKAEALHQGQSAAAPVQKQEVVIPQEKSTLIQKTALGAGAAVVDEAGETLLLISVLGQPGGEGTVYRTNRNRLVAKIYHPQNATEQRLEKLREMRALPIEHPCVCWPRSILFGQDGTFVGFLMDEAPSDAVELGLSVFKLSSQHIQEKLLPGWNRLSLARVSASISGTFAYLHRNGILMGDVNPRNLLLSPADPDRVYFVDCDSYQVGRHICPVGVAEYSSPEILHRLDAASGGYATCPRTVEDEQFALASLLFHVLMLGQAPFAAKNSDQIELAIREYHFAYRTRENRGMDVPDGPYALIWNNTPPNVRDRFADVFTGKCKYSAEVWETEFRKYANSILAGRSKADLLPKKYFDATGEFFRDFQCASCHQEANMPAEKMERLTTRHRSLLCNQCMAILFSVKDVPATQVCDTCRRNFAGNQMDLALQELGDRYNCPSCRARKAATRQSRSFGN